MGDQERLDSAPQLAVGRAFAVQDGDAIGGRIFFEGRQEDGLHAARVERHGWSSLRLLPSHASFPGRALSKEIRNKDRFSPVAFA